MSRVFIESEERHEQRSRWIRSDGDSDNVGKWITIEELVSVLNSASQPGPDRFYILRARDKRPLPFGYESLPMRNDYGAGFFTLEQLRR
jgi:hypothetical protein